MEDQSLQNILIGPYQVLNIQEKDDSSHYKMTLLIILSKITVKSS